jgi:hypothetical protein
MSIEGNERRKYYPCKEYKHERADNKDPAGVVFSGSPQPCTASATGVGNAAVSGSVVVTHSGGPVPSAGGTYAVSTSFTSGNSNYADDTSAGSLTIAKAGRTITFGVLAPKTFGDPDITISATSSSGLTVIFRPDRRFFRQR